jgi:acetyl esterase/lipase
MVEKLLRRSLVAAPLALIGCGQAQLLGAANLLTRDSRSLRVDGAAFGPDPRQKLDLYAPERASDAPVVLFTYGGSWRQGERAQYRFLAERLVARGFVVAIADYRLAPAARYPAFVEDFALAAAWVLANAGRHGGDPARLTLLGHSAGAYNALVVALDPRWMAAAGADRARLSRVVALAPPTGAELQRSRFFSELFAAADPPGSAWPIRLAANARAAPPITLVAGEADMVIRRSDVRALEAAIRRGGGQVDLVEIEGAGHIGLVSDAFFDNPRAEAWLSRLSA